MWVGSHPYRESVRLHIRGEKNGSFSLGMLQKYYYVFQARKWQ